MKFIRILIQAIIFVGLILVIFQNQAVFTHQFELGLNLQVWNSGTFVTSNIVLIAAAFLLGVILTILWGAFSSVGKSSTIKEQKKKIKELESTKSTAVSSYSADEIISSEAHDVVDPENPFKSPD